MEFLALAMLMLNVAGNDDGKSRIVILIRINRCDVILPCKPDSWDGLFELYGKGDVPTDFMGPADRSQPPQDRDPLKRCRKE